MRFNKSAKICAHASSSHSELEFYIYIDCSAVQGPTCARKISQRSGNFFDIESGGHPMCSPFNLWICECGPCNEKFANPCGVLY